MPIKENTMETRQIRALRDLSRDEQGELINLYHLARVPLSGKLCTRYTRMLWASDEFAKAHDDISSTGAYKHLDRMLS